MSIERRLTASSCKAGDPSHGGRGHNYNIGVGPTVGTTLHARGEHLSSATMESSKDPPPPISHFPARHNIIVVCIPLNTHGKHTDPPPPPPTTMQDMDAADPFAPPTAPVLPTQIRKASSTQMSMAMFVTKRAPVPEPSAEEYEATQLKNDALQEEQKEFRHAVAKREEELRNAWALHKGGRAGKEVGVFGRKTKEETWATKLETMLLAEAQRVGEDLPPRPPMPDRFPAPRSPTPSPPAPIPA